MFPSSQIPTMSLDSPSSCSRYRKSRWMVEQIGTGVMNTEPLRYPALMDGEEGAYGVVFPDLPGCVAMGYTVEDAIVNAEDAMRDWVDEMEKNGWDVPRPSPFQSIEVPEGCQLVSIPLIRVSGRRVRANLTLDEGVAAFIDSEARRRKMTRTAYITWMARRIAQMGG